MTTAAGLNHINEGYAYKDGESRQIYNPKDVADTKTTFFQKCFTYGVGPLNLQACLDTSGPSLSVQVTLLGITLADCELSPQHQDCKIGGSVDGFKAELNLSLSEGPLQLTIDGQLCAPFVGCDSLHTVVPL